MAAQAPLPDAQHVLVRHRERRLVQRIADRARHHRGAPSCPTACTAWPASTAALGVAESGTSPDPGTGRRRRGLPAACRRRSRWARRRAADRRRAGDRRRGPASGGPRPVRRRRAGPRPADRHRGCPRPRRARGEMTRMLPLDAADVEVAVRPDQETGDGAEPGAEVGARAGDEAVAGGVGRERPDVPVGVVAEEVLPAVRRREARAVDEDAAGDALAVAVVVPRPRRRARRSTSGSTQSRPSAVGSQVVASGDRVAERALAPGPAVVLPLGDEVHLLVADLAHVPDPEPAGLGVEPEPEGVAESPGPDLGARRAGDVARDPARCPGSRRRPEPGFPARRAGCRRDGPVEVDAQHLPVRGGEARRRCSW